jgi:hypothetical protein
MKFLNCPNKYVGQIGRAFRTRQKEHMQVVTNNNSNSGYSNHIINIGRKYGTITDTIDIMRTHRKRKHLNTLEKYHIFKVYKDNLLMNDIPTNTR